MTEAERRGRAGRSYWAQWERSRRLPHAPNSLQARQRGPQLMDFLDARLVSIIHQQIYCWRLLEPDMLTSLTYTGYGLPMNMVEQLLADFRTQGSHLYKVKSPSKLLQRQFFLDSSNMVLYYTGSRRKGRKTDIPIAKIQEVREGEKDFSKKLNGVDRADTNKTVGRGKPTLDREEFVRFYNMLTRRPELEEVFLKYSRGKGYMVVRDILAFLKEGQRMLDVDEEFCSGLVHHCEPDSACKRQGKLTMLGFKNFLMSEQQFLFNSEHSTVYQDMTRPMTHYFINSSHNTYLAEDQLRGPSRVEMYISALSKGCRCVELDCWDGPDNEPIIYHGYTLTSKILFKDVIKAVKEYGFKASPYPVILSLENHCSMEQQSVMAQHMDRILGDMIWAPDSELTATPTPESLKYKVIIKGKRLPPVKEGIDEDEVSDEDEAAESKNQMDAGAFAVFSLGESKVEKLIATSALGLNVVTHKKLIRTYPAGSRTDSSNYNPVPAWNHGCQIVALNFQTGGEPMQLNHGRFRDNGGAGYVLKPNLLLADEMFGIVTGNMDRNLCKVLALTIISGIQIPKPNDSKKGEVIDPFIKIEVHGAPSDNAEYSSKVVTNNGFNPRWYETCTFTIRVPELALVRFVVKDEDPGLDDFVAYYCLPFSSMREATFLYMWPFPTSEMGASISIGFSRVYWLLQEIKIAKLLAEAARNMNVLPVL
ncbi:hypothetical protein C0Q70_04505 [Pomacea canaliculata]|uniref:Phosphoinositide phospholipase C n=1 Tax=Pomacea canaliculata TaxID=400727 RepID=A0A2T7PIK1_POMCA|nr:hypothetical protein C0Q70_04505 [Pomacea canaliculata]